MHIHVQNLDTVNKGSLEKFFKECKQLGYENNVSYEAIKSDFVRDRKGDIWFLLRDDEIFSMAGCHKFDELYSDSFRILFRGCNLTHLDPWQGMSRMHFNSACYRELIPYQLRHIEQQGYDINETYITVNKGHRNHISMEMLANKGILYDSQQVHVFYTDQTVWKFNPDKYYQAREKIRTYAV
jgi:hypothetical protein